MQATRRIAVVLLWCGALICSHLSVAWWRAYGGWVAPVATPGLLIISAPGWFVALVGNAFMLAPMIVTVPLAYVLSIRALILSRNSAHGTRMSKLVIAFVGCWTLLLVGMMIFGTAIFPRLLRWPL